MQNLDSQIRKSRISISTKLKLYYTKDHICESLVCRSPLDSCSDGSSLATPDQEYHNFGELEETTRTSSNYMDEDYPARPEIKQSLTGRGDNCGSESSTLETDVCVWRYTPLVVLATQEEEELAWCKVAKLQGHVTKKRVTWSVLGPWRRCPALETRGLVNDCR